MPDSKRFLHPEAIARIARLEVRARHIVEGFLSGIHRSPYFGQSVEFLQHREYAPGDDLRHFDWKVWAKQDRYYIKQFEEDTNLRATLLVDVSAEHALWLGPAEQVRLCGHDRRPLAYLLLRQQDAVGCVAFDESIRSKVPLRTKRNHLIPSSRRCGQPAGRQNELAPDPPRRWPKAIPAAGMMVLISDLLIDRDSLFSGIGFCGSRDTT